MCLDRPSVGGGGDPGKEMPGCLWGGCPGGTMSPAPAPSCPGNPKRPGLLDGERQPQGSPGGSVPPELAAQMCSLASEGPVSAHQGPSPSGWGPRGLWVGQAVVIQVLARGDHQPIPTAQQVLEGLLCFGHRCPWLAAFPGGPLWVASPCLGLKWLALCANCLLKVAVFRMRSRVCGDPGPGSALLFSLWTALNQDMWASSVVGGGYQWH